MAGARCQNPGHKPGYTVAFHLGAVILRYRKIEKYRKAADSAGYQDKRRSFTLPVQQNLKS